MKPKCGTNTFTTMRYQFSKITTLLITNEISVHLKGITNRYLACNYVCLPHISKLQARVATRFIMDVCTPIPAP